MKLTNGEIFMSREPLQRFAKQPMPWKTSFAVIKLGKDLSEHLAVINQVRDKIIKEHGEEETNGSGRINVRQFLLEPVEEGSNRMKQVSNPKWEEFTTQHEELMSQEVEIEFEQITLPDTLEIPPADLEALQKFFRLA